MLDHLDDPRPPVPSDTLARTLQAEGTRRRRRRARVAGGVALAAVLFAGVVVRPWEDDDGHLEVRPSNTPTTESAPSTTLLQETTTTSTTEAPPRLATFPTNTFAAVTTDGRVVLADLDSGEIVVVLDDLGEEHAGGYFVARAPDGTAVYAGGFNNGLWRYAPDTQPVRLATAAAVSVSPDGARLAIVAADGPESQGTIRILDSVTGEVLEEVSVPELTGEEDQFVWATEWDLSGDRLFIDAPRSEQAGAVFVLEPTGALRRLGPPAGLPMGTGWRLGGPASGTGLWVLEHCCTLEAESYDGGRSLLRIDADTGEVIDRRPLDVSDQYFELDVGPDGPEFLLLAPEYEWAEAEGGIFVGSPDGTIEPKEWPAFATVDW